MLARDTERHPAGREDDRAGRGDEQVCELRGGGEDVFDVVDDEEGGTCAEGAGDAMLEPSVTDVDHPERRRDLGHDIGRVAKGGKVDEVRSTREAIGGAGRGRDGQTGLADAARAGQRDEAVTPRVEERLEGVDVRVPAHEGVEGGGECVVGSWTGANSRAIEPLRDQDREVARDELAELLRVAKGRVRDVVAFPEAIDQRVESRLPRSVRVREVDELRGMPSASRYSSSRPEISSPGAIQP